MRLANALTGRPHPGRPDWLCLSQPLHPRFHPLPISHSALTANPPRSKLALFARDSPSPFTKQTLRIGFVSHDTLGPPANALSRLALFRRVGAPAFAQGPWALALFCTIVHVGAHGSLRIRPIRGGTCLPRRAQTLPMDWLLSTINYSVVVISYIHSSSLSSEILRTQRFLRSPQTDSDTPLPRMDLHRFDPVIPAKRAFTQVRAGIQSRPSRRHEAHEGSREETCLSVGLHSQ